MEPTKLELIQETIDNLELLKAEIEWDYSLTYQIALTQAIDELEKVLPKAINRPQGDPIWGYCPKCNTAIYKYQNPNACKWCLQRLDWDNICHHSQKD